MSSSDLIGRLRAAGETLALAIPARNEETTIAAVVGALRPLAAEGGPAAELVVADDGSTDDTAARAREAGARVVVVDEVAPGWVQGPGKGQAMWATLAATRSSLVCWLDADLEGVPADWVEALVAPLLDRPEVALVKADYVRPGDDGPDSGGRVTRLTARPLMRALFPDLVHVRQPLAGEYAARRSVVESVALASGWGVDLGLVLDVASRWGPAGVASVHLGERRHRRKPVADLEAQADAVLAVALNRAGIPSAAFDPAGPVGTKPDVHPLITLEDWRRSM